MKDDFYKTIQRLVALALVCWLIAIPALAENTGASPSGITVSGADGILAFGPNGITASGADGITASGADGITASGADGITASGADSTAITRADGITASGGDGITISGADSFVETGTVAIASAVNGTPAQIGLQGLDPELAVMLNRLTDDRNVDAVVIYHHLPNEADIADLERIGVVGGVRYRVLPIIALAATKAQIVSISGLSSVR